MRGHDDLDQIGLRAGANGDPIPQIASTGLDRPHTCRRPIDLGHDAVGPRLEDRNVKYSIRIHLAAIHLAFRLRGYKSSDLRRRAVAFEAYRAIDGRVRRFPDAAP